MNRLFAAFLICCLFACLWLGGSLVVVRRDLALARANEQNLLEANQAQDLAIRQLGVARAIDSATVLQAALEQDSLRHRLSTQERRLKEALGHVPHLSLDSLLPAPAADALCLQWREAGGRIDPPALGAAPGSPDARAPDPAASGCPGWRTMTVRQAVEWNSLLLRHAGEERLDKAGLRQWAASIRTMREGR